MHTEARTESDKMMDPIYLYELIEDNRDWEVIVLPDNRGVILGDYDLIESLLNTLNLSERYVDGI